MKVFRDSLLKNNRNGEECQKLGNKKNIIYTKNANSSVADKKEIIIKNLKKIYILSF